MESRITAITLRVRDRAAGADLVAPARKQPWGGVSGYFADPDGFRWEMVYNPGLTFDDAGAAIFAEGA